MTCTILRVEPPMLLEHTHVDPGSYMRWELEPVDTGCVLRLSHFVHRRRRRDRQLLRRRAAHLARRGSNRASPVSPSRGTGTSFAEAQAHYASVGLAPRRWTTEGTS